jgi:hypothetical protein
MPDPLSAAFASCAQTLATLTRPPVDGVELGDAEDQFAVQQSVYAVARELGRQAAREWLAAQTRKP